MSVKAVTWALEQEIDDPIAHLLLVNLADYADKEHKCWPGQELLARRIRRSVDTVQRKLRTLEKSHHITSEYRADENGHRTSNLYVLNVDVTVGVVPKNVSQPPKPHVRGVGKSSPNRKTTIPKPQRRPGPNRTMHAAGTLEPSNRTASQERILNFSSEVELLSRRIAAASHRAALDEVWKEAKRLQKIMSSCDFTRLKEEANNRGRALSESMRTEAA